MSNRPNRARSKDPKAKKPLLDDLLDNILPRGPGAMVKRLIVLKVIAWLVKNGLMHAAGANRLKHPDGVPSYIPRRQKIASGEEILVVSCGGEEITAWMDLVTDDDVVVLSRLLDHAFPQNDVKPTSTHYRTLVGLARNQGIQESTVQQYLGNLLDSQTAMNIGLLQKTED